MVLPAILKIAQCRYEIASGASLNISSPLSCLVVKCTRRYTDSRGCQFYFAAVQNGFWNKFLLFIYLFLSAFNAEIYLFSVLTLSSLLLVFFSSSRVNFFSEKLFLPSMPGNERHMSIEC